MKCKIKKNALDRDDMFPSWQYHANPEPMNPEKMMREERFVGFAVSHIIISLAGVAAEVLAGFLASKMHYFVTGIARTVWVAILMAPYAFAGFAVARKKHWSNPKRVRDALWAFLAPAIAAWAWGGLVIPAALAPNEWWAPLGWTLFLLAVPFAFPSAWMVISANAAKVLNVESLPSLMFWVLLAGGIPPLLFLMGSLWGGRGRRKLADQTN